MLTCLAIGDPHFKTTNVEEIAIFAERVINLINDKKPDFVVVLGDLLDKHANIHVFPLCGVVEFLSKIEEIVPLYILVGNHDRPNNSTFLTNEHPFTAMEKWKNTKVAWKVIQDTINGHQFTFVPYVSPGRYFEALGTIEGWQQSTAIFSHQEFRGAKMGAIVSEIGDIWEPHYPLNISGHIHDYDLLQPNLVYTGAPTQHAFGDSEKKTVSLFTFDANKSWTEERIDLQLPRREIIHITYDGFLDVDIEEYLKKGKRLKLVIIGTKEECKSLFKNKKLRNLKTAKVSVAFKEIQLESRAEIEGIAKKSTGSFLSELRNALDDGLWNLYQLIFHPKSTVKIRVIKRT